MIDKGKYQRHMETVWNFRYGLYITCKEELLAKKKVGIGPPPPQHTQTVQGPSFPQGRLCFPVVALITVLTKAPQAEHRLCAKPVLHSYYFLQWSLRPYRERTNAKPMLQMRKPRFSQLQTEGKSFAQSCSALKRWRQA